MKEIIYVILPLYAVWGVGVVILFFRKNLELVWKISALLFLVGFGVWFRAELEQALAIFQLNPAQSIVKFVQNMGGLVLIAILLVWPVVMLYSIFNRENVVIRPALKTATILTLCYLILFFIDHFTPPFLESLLTEVVAKIGKLIKSIASPPSP